MMRILHENAAPQGAVFFVVGAFESSPTLAPCWAQERRLGNNPSGGGKAPHGPTWARHGNEKSAGHFCLTLENPVALFLHDVRCHLKATVRIAPESDQHCAVRRVVFRLEWLCPQLGQS